MDLDRRGYRLSERELTIGAVCARGGSKGVPRKNLRPMHGKPLLARAIEQAQAAQIFDHVVTSTDDEEMAALARACGAEVPGLRPAQLARDDSNKWHVFRHLVTELEARGIGPVGIVADLDTGAALRSIEDIRAAVARLIETGADVCVTAYEADHNPYYNMVEMDGRGIARVCSPPPVPIANRQQAPPVYNLSPAIFAIRRGVLFERDHWSQCRMTLCVIPRERAVDIDTEFDFRLVEFLMGERLRAAR
ncbi:MAG TPA: acylneuraminate cytidylyltransferase family protein [Polyangiaceae bacterium]|jgi:CMP-N-acetylneuraminic acid synthetase|nr:acylneuraminate cytidylyltransferase family protein [Polyangiaceae bacterium]